MMVRALVCILLTTIVVGGSVGLPFAIRAVCGEDHYDLAAVIALGWGVLWARIINWYAVRLRTKAALAIARDRAWHGARVD